MYWERKVAFNTKSVANSELFAQRANADFELFTSVDPSEAPTLEKVPQYSVVMPGIKDTFPILFSLIKEEMKATEGDSKIIVFGTTAQLVRLYAQVFEGQTHLKTYELHSRLSQPARTRAADAFKAAKSGIMFASDGMLFIISCY